VALKQEFNLLAGIFKTYLPPEYPYDVVGAQRNVKVTDFDDKVDIVPVADPNIFSQSQRISMAQTELQLAQANPQMHNMYEAFYAMYSAIGVKEIDKILPPPPQPTPLDPAVENIMALTSKPFQAFKGQNHQAHITSHLNFIATNLARNNPMIMGALEKNCFEHISMMAQEQVEVEFREEMMQLQQMQQMAQQNPQMQQNPQFQQQIMQISMKVEARKATLIAEMMQEFKDEENKIMGQFGNDPIAKLKARELDLRAIDDTAKREQADQKINLDKSKQLMGQEQFDEKLEQNEDLAELRAETSLTKQMMSQDAKMQQDRMKQKDVKILKGPRR
jgi:hypothetical protein